MKQWDGAPASATIFVDQDGVAPYDAETIATADGDSASFDYPVSTPVNVGEQTVPAGYTATIDCGQGPQPYTGGAFPVTAPADEGATLTCTITNRQQLSTVQIVKQWDGAPASATIFVDQDGVAPYDAQTVATADGDSTSFAYPVSTPVNVGETTVPAGYSATIDCGQGPQPYTGGAFPVTAPAGTAPRSPAPSRTRSCSRPSASSSSGSGRLPRRPSSSTRTASRRTTPRRSRPQTATAPPSTTPVRRPSPSERSQCRPGIAR